MFKLKRFLFYLFVDPTKERESILSHFYIEIANSMSILQQEEAKVRHGSFCNVDFKVKTFHLKLNNYFEVILRFRTVQEHKSFVLLY
jgi:TFIIF-interacting CTD phosphatase-like protein